MRILHLSAGDEIEIAQLPPILRGETGPAGPRGINGTNGTNGSNGATGPAGIVWRGSWSASASYAANDAIRHNGAVYRAGINIASTDGLVPGVSPYWVLLVTDGATGPAGVSVIVTSFSNRAAYDAYTPVANELAVYIGTL